MAFLLYILLNIDICIFIKGADINLVVRIQQEDQEFATEVKYLKIKYRYTLTC